MWWWNEAGASLNLGPHVPKIDDSDFKEMLKLVVDLFWFVGGAALFLSLWVVLFSSLLLCGATFRLPPSKWCFFCFLWVVWCGAAVPLSFGVVFLEVVLLPRLPRLGGGAFFLPLCGGEFPPGWCCCPHMTTFVFFSCENYFRRTNIRK